MDHLVPHDTALLTQPANRLLNASGAGQVSPKSGTTAAPMGLLAIKLVRRVCRQEPRKGGLP